MASAPEYSCSIATPKRCRVMPREAISALQTSRLKQTLECAYANVAHYRMKFDAAGVRPHDFKSLADLTKFPFTLKTDLRDNYPFGMFAVPRENLLRLSPRSSALRSPTQTGPVGYPRSSTWRLLSPGPMSSLPLPNSPMFNIACRWQTPAGMRGINLNTRAGRKELSLSMTPISPHRPQRFGNGLRWLA